MAPKKILTDAQKKVQREKARATRAAIKTDPEAQKKAKEKEHERYLMRKEQGKLKSVNDLNQRDKRTIRKHWKQASKTYRAKIKTAESSSPNLGIDTSPSSSTEPSFCSLHSTAKKSGRKKVRKDRAKCYKELHKLKALLKTEKKKAAKYYKRWQRVTKSTKVGLRLVTSPSPNSKVSMFLRKRNIPKDVRKRLVFGECLNSGLKLTLEKSTTYRGKQVFSRILSRSGTYFKKYKMLKDAKGLLRKKAQRDIGDESILHYQRKKRMIEMRSKVTEDVIAFMEDDEHSRMCPGKRDCITNHKVKKQKRLLNDTLQNLHLKFQAIKPYTLSYVSFTRLKPFWIVKPDINKRDTCLCTIHENIQLIVDKLAYLKIISVKRADYLFVEICCPNSLNQTDCLLRKCPICKDKVICYGENTIYSDQCSYYQWVSKCEQRVSKKGEHIDVKITTKSKIDSTVGDLINNFELQLPKFTNHLANIKHQYKTMKHLKENLVEAEVLINIDFSENYACKFGSEIQSVHFGGSHAQITLHTGVLYYKSQNLLITKGFCTMSSSMRHDAAAIWAHLKPIFEMIVNTVKPTRVHFLSDSPSTQYRNKTNFYLLTSLLQEFVPGIIEATWNYSEAGHGKGPPDGIGGVLKRTADRIVAEGKDIENEQVFFEKLSAECPNIKLIQITEADVSEVDTKIPESLTPLKGTMMVHQATWCRAAPDTLSLRKLSCFTCKTGVLCQHFGISITNINSQVDKKACKHSANLPSFQKVLPETSSKYPIGSYVIVDYEGEKFPGVVTSVTARDAQVKVMHLAGIDEWRWPDVVDKIFYSNNSILQLIKPPTVISSTREIYRIPEIKAYQKQH